MSSGKRNLSQLVDEVGQLVGNTDDSFLDTTIKDRLNRNYEDLWRGFMWPGTLMRGTTATVAAQDRIAFDYPVAEILALWQRETPDWIRVFHDPMEFIRRFYSSENS